MTVLGPTADLDGISPEVRQALARQGLWRRFRLAFRPGVARADGRQRAAPRDVKFEEQLLNECGAMLRYASTRGMEIPARAAFTVRKLDNERAKAGKSWRPEPQEASELAAAHWSLSRLVGPATPKSITLLNEQSPKTRWVALFGAVLVVRVMMCLAVLFLLAFLVLLPIAGKDPVAAIAGVGTEHARSWAEGFVSAVYILLAAGLGVLFSELFRINRQISRCQYDPTEDAVHITTLVLGLIAGVILAMLLSDVFKDAQGTERFSQPLLALLGGFSAPAVHNVVSRLVDALGTLVGGDPHEQTAAEVQEAVTRARATSEQDRRRIAARAMRIGEDAAVALRLDDLTKREDASRSVRADIRSMMSELLPDVEDEPAPGA